MGKEIERKFLVAGDFRPFVVESARIRQGYLSLAADRTVRVRVKGEKGYLTVKGRRSRSGLSRFEWEQEIPLEEALELLELCGSRTVEKVRHRVPVGRHVFEVDEFRGENEGLVVAEVELSEEEEVFERPEWLGREVSREIKYCNSMLIRCPYGKWAAPVISFVFCYAFSIF
jgi:CYTH domain-containing protein